MPSLVIQNHLEWLSRARPADIPSWTSPLHWARYTTSVHAAGRSRASHPKVLRPSFLCSWERERSKQKYMAFRILIQVDFIVYILLICSYSYLYFHWSRLDSQHSFTFRYAAKWFAYTYIYIPFARLFPIYRSWWDTEYSLLCSSAESGSSLLYLLMRILRRTLRVSTPLSPLIIWDWLPMSACLTLFCNWVNLWVFFFPDSAHKRYCKIFVFLCMT